MKSRTLAAPLSRAAVALCLSLNLAPLGASAQQRAAPMPWADAPAARAAVPGSVWSGRLTAYRPVTADRAALEALLAQAPLEGTAGAAPVLALPTPDGGTARFRIVEAPVMEPALAARYPQIKTFAGIGLDDPTATLRCDLTPAGFHAQVLSRLEGKSFYLDPLGPTSATLGVSYWRQNLLPHATQAARPECQVIQPAALAQGQQAATTSSGTAQRVTASMGTTLRTYRLALAATGEYTAFFGGTKALALAAMVTSVNRVTGVYEKELAVRLVLVANTDQVIYTNANTDPYTNDDGFAMLGENQTNITAVIGTSNYDIGHVFSTGGGGVASLGSVCLSSSKARGVTGSSSPVADAFDIDYVAHEIGHQFGGNHPFNGSTNACSGGNRNATTAWEPGSGSTIMAYAGICSPQDLQPHSDPYFHGGNFAEMATFITSTTCAVSASSGNTPPTVTTIANKSIPASTPFQLTGSATDANSDVLTYNWEEMDLGAAGAPVTSSTVQTANSTVPLFRSWAATTSPTRYFPRLSDLRNNTFTTGEMLPKVARTMKFRLTVRDQHFSTSLNRVVGGVNQGGTVTLTVVNTGAAFAVTAPNTAVNLTGGSSTNVTWNVAGTTANGINCATVDILLSTDGGLTFPTVLLAGTANDGSQAITVPNTATTQGRIMVAASGNYFFDISNANFTITAAVLNPTITSFTPTSAVTGATVTITGTNFTGATAVKFNGVAAAAFTVNSATSITATVPATATTGTLSVTKASSTATSAATFKVLPTISSFTPTSAATGASVTITGTGLTGATAVKFNAVAATTFAVVNSTTVTATIPATATTGKISLTTPGGTATSTASLTVAPVLTSFTPTRGAPGSVVLIIGRNFVSGTTVKINGVNATTTFNSSTQLTAVVPAAATTGPITATAPAGAATSATNYTVVTGAIPTIASFTPTTNVIAGTLVTITGTNFTGATAVRFNNVNGTGLTVLSATQVRATVPAGATTGKVYVTTPSGMAQSASSLTIIAPPNVTSFAPTAGSPNAFVLIAGTNLTGATAVKFNGVSSTTFTVNSATQISAKIPTGATTGKISVTTIAGTATSTANFTVTTAAAPTITSLSPASGMRGSSLIVNGTNFTTVTAVKIGTVTVASSAYTVNSATRITLTVPSTAVTGAVYVTAAGGMAQSPTVFTVLLTPTISSFTPTSGPAGTLVTINGTNFAGITAVRFGGVAATSFTIVSTARITATVPAAAVTGTIQVVNAAGTATSAGTFTKTGARPVTVATEALSLAPIELAVYPNPTHDWVSIDVTNLPTPSATAEVLDGVGRVVRTATVAAGHARVDVSGLTPGLYVVRVAGQLQRLVIE